MLFDWSYCSYIMLGLSQEHLGNGVCSQFIREWVINIMYFVFLLAVNCIKKLHYDCLFDSEMCTWDLVDGQCIESVKLYQVHSQIQVKSTCPFKIFYPYSIV